LILPTKHIPPQRSLVGVGALVLRHLERPQTVTNLWDRVRRDHDAPTFERFVLALDLLYAIGAVGLNEGLLRKAGK
jgi:hypothetical protein